MDSNSRSPGRERVIPFGEGEAGNDHGDDKRQFRDVWTLSGTEGSNPAPSCGESGANSVPGHITSSLGPGWTLAKTENAAAPGRRPSACSRRSRAKRWIAPSMSPSVSASERVLTWT
jgi:hypothetical protein